MRTGSFRTCRRSLPFALAASLSLTVAIGGCGGSSDAGEEEELALAGQVIDAVTGVALEGVRVGDVDDEAGVAGTSGPEGRFRLGPLRPSDVPDLRFVLDGYREAFYARPTLGDGETTLETVALVPEANAGEGGLSGLLTTSDGQAIVAATLRFLAGINVRDGEADATTRSGPDGSWQVTGLPYGNYTCIILIEAREPIYRTVQVFGGIERGDQDVVLEPFGAASDDAPAAPLPPPSVPADFVPGLAGWRLADREYAASTGRYAIDTVSRTGRLELNELGGDVDGPNGLWADGGLTISHSFGGEGSYRLLDSAADVERLGRSGERVAAVRASAGSSPGLLESYAVVYDAVAGASIEATLDERGRYRFSSTAALAARRVGATADAAPAPPDAEADVSLEIDEAFVP